MEETDGDADEAGGIDAAREELNDGAGSAASHSYQAVAEPGGVCAEVMAGCIDAAHKRHEIRQRLGIDPDIIMKHTSARRRDRGGVDRAEPLYPATAAGSGWRVESFSNGRSKIKPVQIQPLDKIDLSNASRPEDRLSRTTPRLLHLVRVAGLR